MTSMVDGPSIHESATFDTFVVRERRERYRFLLARPDRRRELVDRLNHCADLDPRHATWLPGSADVVAMLRAAGSPEQVHVISGHAAIDGRSMALPEAVHEAAMGGWGTLVSCLPGRLAFYYDEQGARRALLRRIGLGPGDAVSRPGDRRAAPGAGLPGHPN